MPRVKHEQEELRPMRTLDDALYLFDLSITLAGGVGSAVVPGRQSRTRFFNNDPTNPLFMSWTSQAQANAALAAAAAGGVAGAIRIAPGAAYVEEGCNGTAYFASAAATGPVTIHQWAANP